MELTLNSMQYTGALLTNHSTNHGTNHLHNYIGTEYEAPSHPDTN